MLPRFYTNSHHEIHLLPVAHGTRTTRVPAMAAIPGVGAIQATVTLFEAFTLTEIRIDATHSCSLFFTETTNQVQLRYQLSGSVKILPDQEPAFESSFTVAYRPKCTTQVALAANETFHCLLVGLPDAVLAAAAYEHTLQHRLLRLKAQAELPPGSFPVKPIPVSLLWIMADLLQADFADTKKSLLIKARLHSLSLLSLNQLQQKNLPSIPTLTYRDTVKLLHAKDAVDRASYTTQPVKEIIRHAGLDNRFLRVGFKRLFGSDVATYIPTSRLQHAYFSLVLDDAPMDEIAEAAGYKSVSSFITAFKMQYGNITPAVVRKHYAGKVFTGEAASKIRTVH